MVTFPRKLLYPIGLILLLLASCRSQPAAPQEGSSIAGRIMVWHSWGEEGTVLLDTLVGQYQAVHPDAIVVVVAQSPDEIYDRFVSTAGLGLGPDLVIGSNSWLADLVEQNLISQVSSEVVTDQVYYREAIKLSSVNDALYAIPVSLRTPALYTNTQLTNDAPASYDALLDAARDGHRVALSAKGHDAFVGVAAFGPTLLNEVDGGVQLDLVGFEQWLLWLKEAQENANIVVSQDEASLIRLFSRGEISYFLGSYEVREALLAETAAQEEEDDAQRTFSLGIGALPSGPAGPSRAALEADLIYFNSASSERQRALALAFAQFLTNSEQSNGLLRDLNIVPANRSVRVNRVIYPLVQPFTQNSRTATALPLSLEPYIVGAEADILYTAVLSGVLEPKAALCEWYTAVEAAFAQLVDDAGYCSGEP